MLSAFHKLYFLPIVDSSVRIILQAIPFSQILRTNLTVFEEQ